MVDDAFATRRGCRAPNADGPSLARTIERGSDAPVATMPRGCGKTEGVMKLSVPALELWQVRGRSRCLRFPCRACLFQSRPLRKPVEPDEGVESSPG